MTQYVLLLPLATTFVLSVILHRPSGHLVKPFLDLRVFLFWLRRPLHANARFCLRIRRDAQYIIAHDEKTVALRTPGSTVTHLPPLPRDEGAGFSLVSTNRNDVNPYPCTADHDTKKGVRSGSPTSPVSPASRNASTSLRSASASSLAKTPSPLPPPLIREAPFAPRNKAWETDARFFRHSSPSAVKTPFPKNPPK